MAYTEPENNHGELQPCEPPLRTNMNLGSLKFEAGGLSSVNEMCYLYAT